jgi:hypothetical protein
LDRLGIGQYRGCHVQFLFRNRNGAAPEIALETQCESFERMVAELNALIDTLPDKPRVTIDPATGHILPEMPDQFPDEAMALPTPESSAPESSAPESSAAEAA